LAISVKQIKSLDDVESIAIDKPLTSILFFISTELKISFSKIDRSQIHSNVIYINIKSDFLQNKMSV
jgi:hypothetical protein